MTNVIDTNVLLVANGQHANISEECLKACVERLLSIQSRGRVVIDDKHEILSEYLKKTEPQKGNKVGDMFLLWLLQNKTNLTKCDQVPIERNSSREWESFPHDPRLVDFDREDRKFVAVSAQHPEHPPILQAADTKWLGWAPGLKAHGIVVEFLCPTDLSKFRKSKTRKTS
jgi:hypothetical protein